MSKFHRKSRAITKQCVNAIRDASNAAKQAAAELTQLQSKADAHRRTLTRAAALCGLEEMKQAVSRVSEACEALHANATDALNATDILMVTANKAEADFGGDDDDKLDDD